MLGRLTIDSLPFYSGIALTGALVTVGGAIAIAGLITWYGNWRVLWSDWLTSVDHKRIGIMYIVLALVMLVRGFVDAFMMRSQQALAYNSPGYLPPGHFDQIFSAHGTIMIFFVAMPFLTGLINVVVPQQIGARDVSFPFMNSLSLGLTGAGAALVLVSLVIGKFSTAGWSAYPPYAELTYSPGVGVDYWIWAVLISGVGSTLTGINFLVTIMRRRAPGMTLMRMPLFTWTALVTSVLMVFAFPALTVAAGDGATRKSISWSCRLSACIRKWSRPFPESACSATTRSSMRPRQSVFYRSRSGCITSSPWDRAPRSMPFSALRQ